MELYEHGRLSISSLLTLWNMILLKNTVKKMVDHGKLSKSTAHGFHGYVGLLTRILIHGTRGLLACSGKENRITIIKTYKDNLIR